MLIKWKARVTGANGFSLLNREENGGFFIENLPANGFHLLVNAIYKEVNRSGKEADPDYMDVKRFCEEVDADYMKENRISQEGGTLYE